jgi:aldose 1-epimerase
MASLACLAVMITSAVEAAPVSSKPFGTLRDGEKVELYTLKNNNGVAAEITTYGAAVVSLVTPDRTGKPADIALGFDSVKGYTNKAFLKLNPFFGGTIGRYANRIADGQFVLDGQKIQVDRNDHGNSLHGGSKGFDKRVWQAEILPSKNPSVRFKLHSADGDQGYPGAVDVSVTYTLTDQNDLEMAYTANTTKKTVINLTNHTYYNLAGEGSGTILNHVLQIPADYYTPVNAKLIPTGELKAVEGTPMDFRKPHAIGEQITEVGGQPVGYDHNYVVNKKLLPGLKLNAEVYEPVSGRLLQVYSDQPGVQFYSGNFLDGTVVGKSGKAYTQYTGFCLEPQHFPDSPNQPKFPSVVLEPGKAYSAKITVHFGTK